MSDLRDNSDNTAEGGPHPFVGQQIGSYTIVDKIGDGGFGEVYEAKDAEANQRPVALKIIKPERVNSETIARFETECRTLALMNHANIAKVYRGGKTSDGSPYIAMELVQRGEPITKYSDDTKASLAQRLDLFQEVCAAVLHAHQKGIIHCDLKPSNILITTENEKPVVKVIDFGIAKALAGDGLSAGANRERVVQGSGTLGYMSPEQAGGSDVDARSDIYSLGVLLFRLLTGKLPFDPNESDRMDMRTRIRSEEPELPSVVLERASKTADAADGLALKESSRQIRGELDAIVVKCLRKQRENRYDTARGLSRDVGSYLRGDPVSARVEELQKPRSVVAEFRANFYVIQKAIGRYKLLVASLVASLLVVGLVSIVSAVFLTRARIQSRDVDRENSELRGINNELEADNQSLSGDLARWLQVKSINNEELEKLGGVSNQIADVLKTVEVLTAKNAEQRKLLDQLTVELRNQQTNLALVQKSTVEEISAVERTVQSAMVGLNFLESRRSNDFVAVIQRVESFQESNSNHLIQAVSEIRNTARELGVARDAKVDSLSRTIEHLTRQISAMPPPEVKPARLSTVENTTGTNGTSLLEKVDLRPEN